MTSSAPEELFVYGTLLPGQANFRRIAPMVSGWRLARTCGRLIYLPFGYPALVEAEASWVRGSLLSFKVPTEEVLEVCDQIEGYRPECPAENLYVRIIKTVEPLGEEPRQAWCYRLASEGEGGALVQMGREIPGGDWLAFRRRRY